MSSVSDFTPIEIVTTEPYQELKRVCANFKDIAEYIDFKLKETFTTYTNKMNEEPVSVTEDKMNIFDNDDFYLDESLKITQSYRVEFYDIRTLAKPNLPRISIGVNKSLTKVVATLLKTQGLSYESGYEEFLYEYISKQLLRAKILLNIRTKDLKSQLKKIASIVRIKEMLDRDIPLVISSGSDPKLPMDAKTIYLYKEKNQQANQSDKVDYASRGFLLGVVEGETIIEQTTPVPGRPGRNVRGEYIQVPVAKEDGTGDIEFNPESIQRIQSDKGVKFIALKPGFISEDKGVFDIKEQFEIHEINFKTTGSVETGLDTNVSLIIKEDDVIKDAIGSGVVVEASEVDVRGSVGANAVINANLVSIGGQTHAKAKVSAKIAHISVHIGSVDADEVNIERLEGGNVVARVAKIGQVVGGSITAEHVEIDTLGSNCTITALSTIEVKNLRGQNNKFIIDSSKMKEQRSDIEGHLLKIEKVKSILTPMPKRLEAKRTIIEENKGSIYIIKSKIEELKKAKIVPHVTFLKKLKEYQALVDEYNQLLVEYKDTKKQLSILKEELDVMQNGIFAAKIINHSRWLDLNEIKFVIIDPPKQVNYATRENEMARTISLQKIDLGNGNYDYEIKKSNEILKKLKEDD